MRTRLTLHAALIAAMAAGTAPTSAQQDGDAPAQRSDQAQDLEMSERREELIRQADEALAQLRRENETAAALLDEAYGHAVFNATKGGLFVTGAGGTGVARPNEFDEVTFMRLGSAGIGLGAGFESYKLVLLFADEETYANFITGQWDGTLAAQASAGREGVSATEQFLGGVRAFHLTDGGLMAQVDVTGTRFWPSRSLNQAAEIEARVAAAARTGRTEGLAERADEPTDEDVELAAETPASAEETTVAADAAEPQPERLDELAAERDDIDLFIDAVRTAGLADALTGDTEYTLFAPTDEAFASLSGRSREELLAPENREELIRLLRSHIVADDLDRTMAGNIPEAMTLDGGTVSIDVDGERFTVGGASVLEPDIQRGNLRMHVVDGVLTSPVRVAEAETEPEAEPEDSARDANVTIIDAADEETETEIEVAEAEVEEVEVVDGDESSVQTDTAPASEETEPFEERP